MGSDEADRAARVAELGRQIDLITRRGPVGNDRSTPREVRPPAAATPDEEARAKEICLRLLTIAPRPRARLAVALRRKLIPDEVAERVLDRLTEVGLIDDAAYAEAFVRTKHRDRGLGRTALRAELRKLGVDGELSGAAVEQLDAEDERRRAAELVGRRLPSALTAGTVAARRRLMSQLARRGYPAELAVSVVEEALAMAGADEPESQDQIG